MRCNSSSRIGFGKFTSGSKWILAILCAATLMLLAGCGGNDNLTLQNQPAPASTSPSIAFDPKPIGSINLIGSALVTAVVSNDPTDAGVDWILLCQTPGNCGTLTSLHTASGKPTTYKPPASITGNSQTVTIEAFAAANHSSNIVTSLAITGFDTNLKGKYVFQGTGEDAFGSYQVAGVVALDGNGNVTSGEQTYNDPNGFATDSITGGTYYVGPDGRGTLTLNTNDQNIGQLGVENFALVFLTNSKVFLQTLDSTTNVNLPPSDEMSAGTLELQTSTAPPTGGYAFVANGVDVNIIAMDMGGVLDIDSPNTISGNGSVADQDDGGSLQTGVAISGTVTTPDSFGSVKFNLTAPKFNPSAPIQFTGYIVDSSHIKLIESDNAGSGVGFGSTVGVAVGQGAATGTFTSNSAFAGNYIFDIAGEDPAGIPLSLGSFGQFSADGSGNINSGYNDEVFSAFDLSISDSITGTYALDSSGTGRIDSTVNFTVNGPGPELIFYLTGNGNPPLVLDVDQSNNGIGSVGFGYAHPQAAPPYTFNGKYGFEFIQSNLLTENTATGQVTANSTNGMLGVPAPAGVLDINADFVPEPAPVTGGQFTGTFGPIPTSGTGRFTGTLTDPILPTFAVAYYPVDANQIFFIETDYATSGILTFGVFEPRTPVCSGCP
jgi:hypothetical protein